MRNISNSPRLLELKKKRRKIFLVKFLIFGLGFLIFFLVLAYISRIDKLNINGFKIIGNKVVETGVIRDVGEEKLEG